MNFALVLAELSFEPKHPPNAFRDPLPFRVSRAHHEHVVPFLALLERLDVVGSQGVIAVSLSDLLHPADRVELVETFERLTLREQLDRRLVGTALLAFDLGESERLEAAMLLQDPHQGTTGNRFVLSRVPHAIEP